MGQEGYVLWYDGYCTTKYLVRWRRGKREGGKKTPQSSSESRLTSGISLVANSRSMVDAACLGREYGCGCEDVA